MDQLLLHELGRFRNAPCNIVVEKLFAVGQAIAIGLKLGDVGRSGNDRLECLW